MLLLTAIQDAVETVGPYAASKQKEQNGGRAAAIRVLHIATANIRTVRRKQKVQSEEYGVQLTSARGMDLTTQVLLIVLRITGLQETKCIKTAPYYEMDVAAF